MARARRKGDIAYNARRRYVRAASRYLKQAKKTVGVEAARYRNLARDAVEKAASLYERQGNIPRKGEFTRLADELGVDLREHMVSPQDLSKEQQVKRERVIEESKEVSGRGLSTQDRRDAEARAILSGPLGSRIYAGLVDVWSQPQFDETGQLVNRKSTTEINKAIMDYFGASSMMDVIEQLEKRIDLYADPESLEKYDTVSLAIQDYLYTSATAQQERA